MNNYDSIQKTLEIISFIALGGLMIFQWSHYVIGSWRFWKGSQYQSLKTISVGLFWIIYGSFFVYKVTSTNSYIDSIPYVLLGLYLPTLTAIILLLASKTFRRFVDSTSLRWTIQSVEGPARMVVGIIFLFWYFAGRLPGIVAWIAGPGDWIAGFISFYAVSRLDIFRNKARIKSKHWSFNDYKKLSPKINPEEKKKMKRNLTIAILFVAFGILDFILAPASTAVSIFLGNIPEEMGRIPLTFIPLVLVPQVLLLEIFAMRQLLKLHQELRKNR